MESKIYCIPLDDNSEIACFLRMIPSPPKNPDYDIVSAFQYGYYTGMLFRFNELFDTQLRRLEPL